MSNTVQNSGVGSTTVLLLIFIVLKLCKVISWSWWWVTAPLWIPVGIVVLCIIIWFVFYLKG